MFNFAICLNLVKLYSHCSLCFHVVLDIAFSFFFSKYWLRRDINVLQVYN